MQQFSSLTGIYCVIDAAPTFAPGEQLITEGCADSSCPNIKITTEVSVMKSAKGPGRNRHTFYILLFGEALRCPYKRLELHIPFIQ